MWNKNYAHWLSGAHNFINYILNKSLCVPVRDKVRTRISFSIRYTRSQSGWMWHSLCPIQSPDKGWSLCLAPKGSPFASFVMMSFRTDELPGMPRSSWPVCGSCCSSGYNRDSPCWSSRNSCSGCRKPPSAERLWGAARRATPRSPVRTGRLRCRSAWGCWRSSPSWRGRAPCWVPAAAWRRESRWSQ